MPQCGRLQHTVQAGIQASGVCVRVCACGPATNTHAHAHAHKEEVASCLWLGSPPLSTKRRTNGDLVLLAAQKIVEAWAGNKASAEQKNLGPGKQANKTE